MSKELDELRREYARMKLNCSSTSTGSNGWNSAGSIMKRVSARNAPTGSLPEGPP